MDALFYKNLTLLFLIAFEIAPTQQVDGKTIYLDNAVAQSAVLTERIVLKKGTFHFFSHGRSGELLIEGQWRNQKGIAEFLKPLVTTSSHLNIYGCEFAKGKVGKEAVAYLQEALGITISASDDITGKDGDWTLEAGQFVTISGFESYPFNLQCPTPSVTDPDTDGDGIPNSVDMDDDNDGISDINEGVTASANAILNGNFGTDGATGGNLNNWSVNVPGSTPTVTWAASGGGAITFVDGAEGYNLSQSNVPYKTATTPSTATFSFRVYTQNAAGVPIAQGWGKLDIYVETTAGLVKLFRITDPLTASLASPTTDIEQIDPTLVQNLAVDGNYTARSFPTGTYVTITATINTATLVNSGILIAQRKNGAGSGPNGVIGADDFLVDDFSYTYQQGIDTDGDGIPNHLDLDSDNDGIPDAIEACGNISLTLDANCRVPYDAASDPVVNGCPSGLPTSICATPLNSDGNGDPDYLDLDSDDDLCPDAREAGTATFNVNTTEYTAPNATDNGLTDAGCFIPSNVNSTDSTGLSVCSLPVKLINFEAMRAENQVQLAWQTTEEVNSEYFEIQRSANAADWQEIGRVSSAGQSENLKNYTWTDKKPLPEQAYYRLKMVDIDRTYAYSRIVSINNSDGEQLYKVYPNPAGGRNIFVSTLAPIESFKVYDGSGKVVSAQMSRFSGKYQVTFGTDVPAGLYVIVIKTGGRLISQKFVLSD